MSEMTLGPEQIACLAVYQEGRVFHPYTCPEDHADPEALPGHIKLIPGLKHWVCAYELCDYTQPYRKEDTTMAEFMYNAIANGDYPDSYS